MRKKRYLILAALLVLAAIIGYCLGTISWECPACASSEGKITPLVNGEYYPALISEIDNAQSSIDIVMYEFKWYDNNNSVVQLRNLLVKRAEEGVKIRIILDQSKWYGQITDLSKENKKTGEYLAEKGISVKFDSEKTTTHDKLVIIDDSVVLVGSHNWGSSALTANNEASVLIKDKEIAEYYKNYFEFLWKNA
jgi:phosphatidylserine/phosphatidylglycerophosphate/cardiolipin synthase-like enzyme